MPLVVFDDKGVGWDANSRRFAETLHSSIEGEALARYSVVNLCFAVAEAIDSSARIRVRPGSVAQPALAALLYWLFDCAPERILISSFEGRWCHELVRASEDIAGQLADAMDHEVSRALDT